MSPDALQVADDLGEADSYFEKTEAEKVGQRVAGVRAVVEKIEVKLAGSYMKDDADIAKAVLSQFEWSYSVPASKRSKTL